MKVVHINLFDKHGGAARISWTLMNYLTQMGHETVTFAHHTASQDDRVIQIPFLQTAWQKKLLDQQEKEGLFDLYSAALLKVLNHPLFEQADLVHLHCINGNYFSFLLLPFLASKPLIWTLHDPLAFTANCLSIDVCNGWKEDWCGACPQDTENKSGLQRELVQLIKSLMYKVSNFTAVCPSAWLSRQAKVSLLQEKEIRLIYNGVDVGTFQPGSKEELRFKLGLPVNQKIILFTAHGGLNNPYKGGEYLRQALLQLYKQYPDIVLLTIGSYSVSTLEDFPILHIDVPFIDNQQQLAQYYAAVDLYVSPTLAEVFGLTICEAMASGTPVVAFAVGGIPELVIHKENGYLVERGNVGELIEGISYFLENEEIRQRAGRAARLRVVEKFSERRMVDEYICLYEEILKKSNPITDDHKSWNPYDEEIVQLIESCKSKGWGFVWKAFHHKYSHFKTEESRKKLQFVDRFCNHCLKRINPISESHVLWDVITQWQSCRSIPESGIDLRAKEMEALYEFIRTLRACLTAYFSKVPEGKFIQLKEEQQQRLYILWQQVFLNDFLSLPVQENESPAFTDSSAGFKEYLLISMYRPMDAEQFNIDVVQLWQEEKIPEYYKVLITFWLLHVPYYNIEEKHRDKILKYTSHLFSMHIPTSSFIPLVNECTKVLWRISYIGGNNLPALAGFGDFIAAHMEQYTSRNKKVNTSFKKNRKKKKIRIGYISRLFYGQAVSYYMINRVIHHNKDNFEVYTFALGKVYDEITSIFEKYSDRFKHFKQIDAVEDVYSVMQSISDSKPDILIYTDIGMDPLTYMLAGLRLVPIQCVLVGHGTTTGLPTIDYYISGDFEPPDASSHYREKLIRLPNLGAAQFPPPFAEFIPVTRKDWKIPEEAVVFVSCANGIKHGPSRDRLLVEILKRVPNACILLKPCHSSNLDNQLGERIKLAARNAGVENRLFIVPPLGRIDALLAIADIQLDTYPYGGWTTSLEGLYMGLPMVTQEGDMARSRWGSHMLRALGIREGIGMDEEEYVEWAVKLAMDKELREQIKKKITKQVKSVLFNGAAAQLHYENALLKIFEDKH
ncbi:MULTISPECIES: glycosyltransferase [Pelosinus]|uniref:Glycosyl transferase group 1 n=1 Tax=Pelosinus fermentans B4 TaxID=1149862 RepID=I9L9S8_9FIRM|nr:MULTISPECIES: glycosyltransferase [Pelosinus]EIW17051.1 glycosyl transferase group 1 [Pelosinus fermentans B4]EIW23150.1 glycosyl transferase group 1 [Pelosinus fermentans A11]OAM93807.1 glycosyl transferase group 1 [Pelosinus fermentans DSM 17108]SDQ90777.1 Glycosyl transferase family 41 [Pelosinus fermentans]